MRFDPCEVTTDEMAFLFLVRLRKMTLVTWLFELLLSSDVSRFVRVH